MGEMLIDLFLADSHLLGEINRGHFPVAQAFDQLLSNRFHLSYRCPLCLESERLFLALFRGKESVPFKFRTAPPNPPPWRINESAA
jgi:hypothetical protein